MSGRSNFVARRIVALISRASVSSAISSSRTSRSSRRGDLDRAKEVVVAVDGSAQFQLRKSLELSDHIVKAALLRPDENDRSHDLAVRSLRKIAEYPMMTLSRSNFVFGHCSAWRLWFATRISRGRACRSLKGMMLRQELYALDVDDESSLSIYEEE
jgi:hypothetical protein